MINQIPLVIRGVPLYLVGLVLIDHGRAGNLARASHKGCLHRYFIRGWRFAVFLKNRFNRVILPDIIENHLFCCHNIRACRLPINGNGFYGITRVLRPCDLPGRAFLYHAGFCNDAAFIPDRVHCVIARQGRACVIRKLWLKMNLHLMVSVHIAEGKAAAILKRPGSSVHHNACNPVQIARVPGHRMVFTCCDGLGFCEGGGGVTADFHSLHRIIMRFPGRRIRVLFKNDINRAVSVRPWLCVAAAVSIAQQLVMHAIVDHDLGDVIAFVCFPAHRIAAALIDCFRRINGSMAHLGGQNVINLFPLRLGGHGVA